MGFKKSWGVVIGGTVVASIIINGMEFLWVILSVANSQSKFLGFIFNWLGLVALVTVFPLLAAVVMILVSVVIIILKKNDRIEFSKILVACLLYILVSIPIWKSASHIRMEGFHKLAKRSTTLVNAIKSYEQKHSRPPEKLQDLVPEFLDKIPNTGMLGYPDYKYDVQSKESTLSDRWKLYIFTPSGGINFDEFVYYPSQKYPKNDPSGWYEPIEDWAYFHE